MDWDLLYVGTCWNINAEVRPPSHIYEDANAPNSTEYVILASLVSFTYSNTQTSHVMAAIASAVC